MPSIAIVGASRDHRKYGNKAVRAYRAAGYRVYPVHPTAESIEGLPAFPEVAALPETVDRISVYLPPAVTLDLLDALRATGVDDIWLNPGAADAAVLRRVDELGLAIVNGCSIVDIGASPSQFP